MRRKRFDVMQVPAILICVGATKAGTSWLHRELAAHPDCHFRTIKELHYFTAIQSDHLERRIKSHQAEMLRLGLELPAATVAKQHHLRRRIADLRDWIAVLSQRSLNSDAYCAYLMSGLTGQRIVGDFTPAYATLTVDTLIAMASIAPDVRFLYLLRDPVARMWSHLRMQARQGLTAPDAFAATVAQRFDAIVDTNPEMGGRGDYAGTIEKLRRAVAPDRLLVHFTEDMLTPAGMTILWSFLGLAGSQPNFDRKVHAGIALAMTPDQQARARVALRPQYDYVADAYPDLPDVWRANMKEVTQ